MLVLSRKVGEEIIIGDRIRVRVLAIQGNQIRLGFVAPRDVQIHREELLDPGRKAAASRPESLPKPDAIVDAPTEDQPRPEPTNP